jgi:hypothetical protein
LILKSTPGGPECKSQIVHRKKVISKFRLRLTLYPALIKDRGRAAGEKKAPGQGPGLCRKRRLKGKGRNSRAAVRAGGSFLPGNFEKRKRGIQ